MNVLIACEESQAVCVEFRMLGHNAYSCDIQECSGGHPEWHVMGDALAILEPWKIEGIAPFIQFQTQDGEWHEIDKWDIIIAHPPCTYLTVTGNRWFDEDKYGEAAIERKKERKLYPSSCGLQIATVRESQSRTPLVTCRRAIGNQTRLYSRISSVIRSQRRRAFG